MNNNKFIITYTIITILSITLIMLIYPHIHFLGGLWFPKTEDEISKIADDMLRDAGHPLEEYYHTIRIERNRSIAMLAEDRWGIRKSNAAYRDSIPGYIRSFRWYVDPPNTIPAMLLPGRRERASGDPHLIVDGNGLVRHFNIAISDTVFYPSLNEEEARTRAGLFLDTHTYFNRNTVELVSLQRDEKENRSDWHFTFSAEYPSLQVPTTIEVIVAGNTVIRYLENYEMPEYLTLERTGQLRNVITIISYILIILILTYLAISRLRSGELGFQTAIFAGIIVAVFYGIQTRTTLFLDLQWIDIIAIILPSIVLAMGVIIGWSTGESAGRQTWREKFIPFDLLVSGHIFHSLIGRSIIRGISFGLLIFLIYGGVVFIIDSIQPLVVNSPHEVVNYVSSHIASVHVFTQSILSALLLSAIFFIPFTSIIRQHTSSPLIPVGVTAVLIAMAHAASYLPLVGGFIILLILGLLGAWIIYRFDILTLLIALTVNEMFRWGMVFFFTGDTFLLQQGFIWTTGLAFLWIAGIASMYTKDTVFNEREIVPSFQRFISERERLQREFEIAHDVQMGFLPSETPDTPALDIAARCIPAKEIGGDYYDFIRLDEQNTAIIIGDVSGKGTKAAFYMTLAKGFIHSTAEKDLPPSQVLTKINSLFYKNTDAGAFISMVYASYNAPSKTLALARAGHNPIVYYSSTTGKTEFIRSQGIAIGLHEGNLFADTIDDIALHVQPGDIIIFYTDGITEAMNKKLEEFGNDRLFAAIREYNDQDAETILDGIFTMVNNFTHREEQSDDMTMVVVKVR